MVKCKKKSVKPQLPVCVCSVRVSGRHLPALKDLSDGQRAARRPRDPQNPDD